MMSLPIEYYEVTWITFARKKITIRGIPIKSAMIDSSNYRYQNGSDVYISRIVKDLLSPEEVTAVSQAHRRMKDTFIDDDSIKAINRRISEGSSIVDGTVSLTVDLGTKNAWENSLVTQLNDVPFGYIGKGAQCVMKTELALTHHSAQNAQIVLLEEPESHLSFSKINQLIKAIEDKYGDKQIIISTHSSFVANKLGLENLLLLDNHRIARITELPSAEFFKKVSGYDTLRLILCKNVNDAFRLHLHRHRTHAHRAHVRAGKHCSHHIFPPSNPFLRFPFRHNFFPSHTSRQRRLQAGFYSLYRCDSTADLHALYS